MPYSYLSAAQPNSTTYVLRYLLTNKYYQIFEEVNVYKPPKSNINEGEVSAKHDIHIMS